MNNFFDEIRNFQRKQPIFYIQENASLTLSKSKFRDELLKLKIEPLISYLRNKTAHFLDMKETGDEWKNYDDPNELLLQVIQKERIPCNCYQISKLVVALLRIQGIPSRVRVCLSKDFFGEKWSDHCILEYYEGEEWRLADPDRYNVIKDQCDPLNVPVDRYLWPMNFINDYKNFHRIHYPEFRSMEKIEIFNRIIFGIFWLDWASILDRIDLIPHLFKEHQVYLLQENIEFAEFLCNEKSK